MFYRLGLVIKKILQLFRSPVIFRMEGRIEKIDTYLELSCQDLLNLLKWVPFQ